jgi:small subunit ribosomal protein S13
MRIAGTNIPTEKPLHIALRYVYGIGPKRALDICSALQLDPVVRVKEVSADDETRIRDYVTEAYVLEADLRREIGQNIKMLQDIGTYRGFRHRRHLPVRGQRTKTNARTRKGRKGAAVTNKKINAK